MLYTVSQPEFGITVLEERTMEGIKANSGIDTEAIPERDSVETL